MHHRTLLPASAALVPAFFLLVAFGFAACSQSGSSGASQENAPIRVEPSNIYITIQNQAGLALTDVRVSVVPYGRTEFTTYYARLENGEKRDFAIGAFMGRDGTPLNLQVVRAKSVVVTAKDIYGKEVRVEVPWK